MCRYYQSYNKKSKSSQTPTRRVVVVFLVILFLVVFFVLVIFVAVLFVLDVNIIVIIISNWNLLSLGDRTHRGRTPSKQRCVVFSSQNDNVRIHSTFTSISQKEGCKFPHWEQPGAILKWIQFHLNDWCSRDGEEGYIFDVFDFWYFVNLHEKEDGVDCKPKILILPHTSPGKSVP